MNFEPDPEPLPSAPSRRTVLTEDALILVCLATLWIPILGYRGPLVLAVMLVSLALMSILLVRRKRRVDALFEEMRRRREEMQALGGFPTMPGMIPPRMGPSDRTDEGSQSARRSR